MKSVIAGIRIRAIAATLPKTAVDIDSYGTTFGSGIRRLKRSTGVERVHLATEGMTASDLCCDAAERLFAATGISPSSIDAIVFASMSPDYKAPATAYVLQARLGLPEEAMAMDIPSACAGYIQGLYQGCLLLSAGQCRRVLLCAGDTQSLLVNARDRSMRMLVGDAGTATLMEMGSHTMHFYWKSLGSEYRYILIPAGGCRHPSTEHTRKETVDAMGNARSLDDLYMNGIEVAKFASAEVPLAVDEILGMLQWRKEDVGLFAFHQPNRLILDHLRLLMDLDEKRLPTALQQTGNTGAASIPLLLSILSARGRDLAAISRILACGFGLGLSIGATNLDLADADILPIQDLEHGFEDGTAKERG